MPSGASESMARLAPCAMTRPNAPPAIVHVAPSMRRWPTSVGRPAPRAICTASSRARREACVSMSPDTFAHATRSSTITAANSAMMAWRARPDQVREQRLERDPLAGQGNGTRDASRARPAAVSCSAAAVRAASWRSRATRRSRPTSSNGSERHSAPARSSKGASGRHTSVPRGKSNSGGATPMTVAGSVSRCTVLPSTRESPPNSRCHVAWLRTTTSGPPRMSSRGSRSRPRRDAPAGGRRTRPTPPRSAVGSGHPHLRASSATSMPQPQPCSRRRTCGAHGGDIVVGRFQSGCWTVRDRRPTRRRRARDPRCRAARGARLRRR